MGTYTLFPLLSILKKEHPSKSGTGLRFLSPRRGLTCIILLRQPTLRADSFSSFHTLILIVRFTSTTTGLRRVAGLRLRRRATPPCAEEAEVRAGRGEGDAREAYR